jgi:hypothetical protein
MTGTRLSRETDNSPHDSPQARYSKMKAIASKMKVTARPRHHTVCVTRASVTRTPSGSQSRFAPIQIIQFGISLFHESKDGGGFVARPFNIYLFPAENINAPLLHCEVFAARVYKHPTSWLLQTVVAAGRSHPFQPQVSQCASPRRSALCVCAHPLLVSCSGLQQVDQRRCEQSVTPANLTFCAGVSYCDAWQEERLQGRIWKLPQENAREEKKRVVDKEDDVKFVNDHMANVEKMVDSKSTDVVTSPPCNSFLRGALMEAVESKYPSLTIDANSLGDFK